MRRSVGLCIRLGFSAAVAAAIGFLVFTVLGARPVWTHPVLPNCALVDWSPQNRWLLTLIPSSQILEFRDVTSGTPLRSIQLQTLNDSRLSSAEPADRVQPFFALSEDERWLAAFLAEDPPGTLSLVDMSTGVAAKKWPTLLGANAVYSTDGVYFPSPSFSADGRWLVCCGQSADGKPSVFVVDVAQRSQTLLLPATTESCVHLAGHDQLLIDHHLWNLVTGRQVGEIARLPAGLTKHAAGRGLNDQELIWLARPISSDERQRLVCFRVDLQARTIDQLWEYVFPEGSTPGIALSALVLPVSVLFRANPLGVQHPPYLHDFRTFGDLGQPALSSVARAANSFLLLGRTPVRKSGDQVEFLGRRGRLVHARSTKGDFFVGLRSEFSFLWREFPSLMSFLKVPRGTAKVYYAVTSLQSGQSTLLRMLEPADRTSVIACTRENDRFALITRHYESQLLEVWSLPPDRPWSITVASGLGAAIIAFAFLQWLATRGTPAKATGTR